MIEPKEKDEFFNNQSSWFIGVVEDILDPLQQGRVKVRAFGIHHESLGRKFLPWARLALSPTTGGGNGVGQSPTGLLRGTWVTGFFLDGQSHQEPVVTGALVGMTNPFCIDNGGAIRFADPGKKYPLPDKVEHNDAPEESMDIPPPKGDKPYYQLSFSWEKKKELREVFNGTQKAFSDTWELPAVEDFIRPKYPKNHVVAYERKVELEPLEEDDSKGGLIQDKVKKPKLAPPGQDVEKTMHVREFDTTPDFERISEIHKSGTYYEIHPDGTKTIVIVGDEYELVAKDKNVRIKGNCNVTIDGDARTLIEGDHYVHVKGNRKELIEGNLEQTVMGDVTEVYESNQTTNVSVDRTSTVGQNVFETYGNDHTYTLENNLDKKIGGDVTEYTIGNLTESVDKDVFETYLGKQNTKIRGMGGWTVNTWSDMNLLGGFYDNLINESANGTVKTGASAILMTGGGSALGSVVDVVSGGFAVHTLAGIIDMFGGRVTINGPGEIGDQGPLRDRLNGLGDFKNGLKPEDILGPILPELNHPAYTPPLLPALNPGDDGYADWVKALDLGIVSIAGVEFPTFASDLVSLVTDLADCCDGSGNVGLDYQINEDFHARPAVQNIELTNRARKPWADPPCGTWPELAGNRITVYSEEARIYYAENDIPNASSPWVSSGQTITLSQLPTTLIIKSGTDDGSLLSDPVCLFYIENPYEKFIDPDNIESSATLTNVEFTRIELPEANTSDDATAEISLHNIGFEHINLNNKQTLDEVESSVSLTDIRWQFIEIVEQ